MQVLIWSYLQSFFIKKTALQQLQGGLCNEFDNFHVKLSFLKVHFSVLAQFVIVHVTSNPQKNLYANF